LHRPTLRNRQGGKKLATDAGVRRNVAERHARSADFAALNLPVSVQYHNDFVRDYLLRSPIACRDAQRYDPTRSQQRNQNGLGMVRALAHKVARRAETRLLSRSRREGSPRRCVV